MDESTNAAEPRRGQPRGTAPRVWSTHRGKLPDNPVSYAHTVRAAARDAVRVALARGPHSPDAAAAVRHLMARLGEQHGPQFVWDVAAKLVVELAEVTAAMAAQDWQEGSPADPD
jgi:hypothetical protein